MFAAAFDPTARGRTTIAGAPSGHDVRVLAEIASRLNGIPLIHVALDDIRAAVMADALAFFGPHCEVLSLPAWDCLPYDRISPHTDIIGERLTVLGRLRKPFKRPCIILTTVNAAVQKTVPPEILEKASLYVGIGTELSVETLRGFLSANGYVSTGTVREPGEFAVRGGIVDMFPPGHPNPIRLDFFGDEVESIRVFDPLTQTTTDRLDSAQLGPISEVLLDERAVAHFRTHYRELFGAVTESDPLYEAVTAARKFPGVEHWLGLFYPKLYSLFDYLPHAAVSLDHQADQAMTSRMQQIDDFYQARLSLYQAARRVKKGSQPVVYKPAPVTTLYLDEAGIADALSGRAVAALSPFTPAETGLALDAGGRRGRDFADARALETDLYGALQRYIESQQAHNKRVTIACYSQGSSDRLVSLLRANGVAALTQVQSYDELRKCDAKQVALIILGFEHGFTAPDVTVITEQDILGDRLVRPARKRRVSAPFQLELGSLNPGDFVVHAEHGIGRYDGLETISVLNTVHDCVKLVYDGGDKLFVPVENLDVLTRYGSAEAGATLDKLGGAAWQTRKARVKKRLKDMADALMKIAAARELKTGEVITVQEGAYQ
ncbi:MAG: transcription-repair coupling factor, partial [Pseudomonadota bacterium]|nr:transcription-repair coupling factor [Pseudomonadota bacterium]